MQSYPPNYNSRHSSSSQLAPSYEDIIFQIQNLDQQNKKLLAIADNIMKTSFLRQYDQTPAVVLQLQEDMKSSFNALIQSIRQFFMSIDNKVKELGQIIELKINQSDTTISFAKTMASPKNNPSMNDLLNRLNYMEENIKRSQQNEAKLIMIIEEMNNKRIEDQPTIRKQSENMRFLVKNNSNQSSQQQNSFRLFAFNNQDKKITDNKKSTSQLYQKFQQYSNHPVIQSIDPSHRKVKQAPGFFCGPMEDQPTQSRDKLNYIKNSTGQFQFQSSNRGHRLNNLLKALKQ